MHFADGGRIEIGSSTVERSIRPMALSRKKAFFAGSDDVARSGPGARNTDGTAVLTLT